MDGLNVRLAQAMSHYQREERKCFVCGSPGHFVRDCPQCDAFKRWHRGQLNSNGVGENSQPTPRLTNTQPEVNVRVIGRIWDPLLEMGGPVSHWIGPETLVDLTIEGRNINALADSGSQVNTITPTVWVSCPATGRPSRPPIEPCRVGREVYESARFRYPAHTSMGDCRV